MVVMYLVLNYLRYKGWKLLFGVWMAFWGLITVLNAIELYWYNEAFPLFTYLDVTKMIVSSLITYGFTTLVGVWLVGGFKRDDAEKLKNFDPGVHTVGRDLSSVWLTHSSICAVALSPGFSPPQWNSMRVGPLPWSRFTSYCCSIFFEGRSG